jgi:hypothetical protein
MCWNDFVSLHERSVFTSDKDVSDIQAYLSCPKYIFILLRIIIRYMIMIMPVDYLILPVKHLISCKNLQVENIAKF